MISKSDSTILFIYFRDVGGLSPIEAFIVGTAIFGVDFDLVDDCFKFPIVNNVLST